MWRSNFYDGDDLLLKSAMFDTYSQIVDVCRPFVGQLNTDALQQQMLALLADAMLHFAWADLNHAFMSGAYAAEILSTKASTANPYSRHSVWRWLWFCGFDMGRRLDQSLAECYVLRRCLFRICEELGVKEGGEEAILNAVRQLKSNAAYARGF